MGVCSPSFKLLDMVTVSNTAVIFVACVTEQTHEIRVYGLCDGVRFAVLHNFA